MEVTTTETITDLPPPLEAPPELEHADEVEEVLDAAPDAAPRAPAPALPRKKISLRTGAAAPKDATDTAGSNTALLRDLAKDENVALRDLIQSYGQAGDFQVYLSRKEPESIRVNGRNVPCAGHIQKWDSPTFVIDEEYIKQKWGGQKYELKFKRRDQRGSWVWAGARTVTIAGDPIVDTDAPQAAPQNASDNPSVANKSLEMMGDMMKQVMGNADKRGPSDGGPIVQILRDTISSQERVIAEMRSEMRALANREPPKEDGYKDVLLKTMLEGDSQRVSQIREAHNAELRQAKESAIELEKRLYDRFERDRQDMRMAHEREIALLRSSHESQLATQKSSYDVQISAIKSSVDTTTRLADAENRRLETANASLQIEIKELRAKKDKTLLDSFKEVKEMKEMLGEDDDSEPDGFMGKLMGAVNPETIGAIGSILRGPAQVVPQQAIVTPAQAQAQLQPKRRVVLDKETGKKMIQEANGTLTEIREAPATAPAGPVWPQVDADVLKQAVSMLESSFQNNGDPDIVAQGIRSRVPEELVAAIRDHGIDQMMSQMAKLPGSSPLSSQAGRAWLRKFSKALVGE